MRKEIIFIAVLVMLSLAFLMATLFFPLAWYELVSPGAVKFCQETYGNEFEIKMTYEVPRGKIIYCVNGTHEIFNKVLEGEIIEDRVLKTFLSPKTRVDFSHFSNPVTIERVATMILLTAVLGIFIFMFTKKFGGKNEKRRKEYEESRYPVENFRDSDQ